MADHITAAMADTHEGLYLSVSALAKHAQAIAGRRGDAGLPDETRRLAEDLLFEVRPFLAGKGPNRLPAAAPGYAGLAAQLGEALAALDAWETRHSDWSGEHKCFVWRVGDGIVLAVRRLRPQPPKALPVNPNTKEVSKIKDLLIQRIAQKWDHGYDRGYRDATAGRPNELDVKAGK
ncbi:MAG TPA: hypothetical protein PK286_04720 [Devosia sp.]|nr:hypothetical protein [Devosia sp.]